MTSSAKKLAIDSGENTPLPWTVIKALALMFGKKEEDVPNCCLTDDGRKLYIGGQKPIFRKDAKGVLHYIGEENFGYSELMPFLKEDIMRVGRHIYKVSWNGPEDYELKRLTVPGS